MEKPPKPLLWMERPDRSLFSEEALLEAGNLLRSLRYGDLPGLPHMRPMPIIGPHCYELRVKDKNHTWRIIVFLRKDAVIVLDVFDKNTNATTHQVIDTCRKRLKREK